jgi:hypothetical protein
LTRTLPQGVLLDGERIDGFLDLGGDPVLEHRLAAANLLQCQFPAFVAAFLNW